MNTVLLHVAIKKKLLALLCGALFFVMQVPAVKAATVPVITTNAITDVMTTSAKLHAALVNDGGEIPTVELKWGTESGIYPYTCTPVTGIGNLYSCDLTGLSAGAAYYVMASATNSAGTGNGSNVRFQTTGAVLVEDKGPAHITDKKCKPEKLRISALLFGKVKLSWKKPCAAIDRMEIERKSGTGIFKKIATVKRDKLSYIDSGWTLFPGEYTYRIRGYREASGERSDYSGKKAVIEGLLTRPAIVGPDKHTGTQDQSDRQAPDSVENSPAVALSPSRFSESSPLQQTVSAAGQFFDTYAMGIADFVFPGLVAGAATAGSVTALSFATSMATVTLTGFSTGAAMVGSSTAIPLFATSPASFTEVVSRLMGMLGFIGKRKREDGWGTVFDSETRQPVGGAEVSILNEDGSVADVSVSDSRGHYGFLPDPGTYTLKVSKKGYNLEKSNQQDILYDKLYVGQPIRIEKNDAVKISIALKTTVIDWQDFARRKIASYTSVFSIVKRDVSLVLFYAGFVINAGIAYLFPTTFNIAFFAAYLVMAIRFRRMNILL